MSTNSKSYKCQTNNLNDSNSNCSNNHEHIPLTDYKDLPEWAKDNPFIYKGYRLDLGWKRAGKSICKLHNETFNVWIHFGACIFMFFILIFILLYMPYKGSEYFGNTVDSINRPSFCHNLTLDKFNVPVQCDINIPNDMDIIEKTSKLLKTLPSKTRKNIIQLKDYLKEHFYNIPIGTNSINNDNDNNDNSIEEKTLGILIKDLKHSIKKQTEIRAEQLSEMYNKFYKYMSNMLDINEHNNYKLQSPLAFLHHLDFSANMLETLPRWPIAIFLLSAMVCFGSSAFFHLFSAVDRNIHIILNRLDYAGISFLIGGSNFPIIYYMFYCSPIARTFYLSFIALGCLATFYASVHPTYAGNKYRTTRTLLFIILGVSGVVPLLHLVLLDGVDFTLVIYLVTMGGLYISGAVVYVTQVPERCYPGKFDIYCSSHQWWHVFTFAAALVHLAAVKFTFEYRIVNACPAY